MKINPAQLGVVNPLRPSAKSGADQVADAGKLQQAYRDFVGKTFFGEMLKSMRSTVGKPAYFHGGQAEEVFRSQLDQHLADHMTAASAGELADPMFRLQFPQQAALLEQQTQRPAAKLTDLDGLRRR